MIAQPGTGDSLSLSLSVCLSLSLSLSLSFSRPHARALSPLSLTLTLSLSLSLPLSLYLECTNRGTYCSTFTSSLVLSSGEGVNKHGWSTCPRLVGAQAALSKPGL